MKQKRRGLRGAGWFMGIVLLCLFFSRSIAYFCTPKVLTERPRSGVLTFYATGEAARWQSDDPYDVRLAAVLTQGLTVESVEAEKGKVVDIGDGLLRFSRARGERLLAEAESRTIAAEDALLDWEHAYIMEETRLTGEIERLTEGLRFDESEAVERLSREAELREARLSLDYLQNTRIAQGKSRAPLAGELARCEAEERCLRALRDDDWTIRAERAGRVTDVYYEKGAEADGALPLSSIAPREAKLSLRCALAESERPPREGELVRIPWQGTLAVEFRVARLEAETAWLEPTDAELLWDLDDIPDSLALTYTSEKYDLLVPNRAAQGDTAYVLREREAFWGKELYAEAVRVRVGAKDDLYTAVLDGLSREDAVITNWDRPFASNDVVTRPIQ